MKMLGGFTFYFLYNIAPTAAPENLEHIETSSTSITVQWASVPCAHRNGEITHYVIRYGKINSTPVNESIGSVSTYTIKGLEPSTEYEIQVAAFTVALGPFTNESLKVNTTGTYISCSSVY